MKILIRTSWVAMLIVITFSNFKSTTEKTIYPHGVRALNNVQWTWFKKKLKFWFVIFFFSKRNFGFFERIVCKTYPGSKVSNVVSCRAKNIDRKNVAVDVAINVTKPINGLWIHAIGYYKYNTYQKIATEYWDDYCAWRAGKSSFLLDFLRPVIEKYSNFNQTCPFLPEVYFLKFDNLSVQMFTIPQIMPGRSKQIVTSEWKALLQTHIFT